MKIEGMAQRMVKKFGNLVLREKLEDTEKIFPREEKRMSEGTAHRRGVRFTPENQDRQLLVRGNMGYGKC